MDAAACPDARTDRAEDNAEEETAEEENYVPATEEGTSLALLRDISNRIPLHGAPYAATDAYSQTVRDWEWHVNQVMLEGDLARTHSFRGH